MDEKKWLAERFEENRAHLRAIAYRMTGSLGDAEDAVQEAWLRLSRSDTESVENLGGWLTTVVARICLDMLRSRRSRSEQPLDEHVPERVASDERSGREQEAELADSVGLALLVVLEKLTPAERLAFVLHDLFDLPFDEIAGIVGRSPTAARQLASRARRRVRGTARPGETDLATQRWVVEAFVAASRSGNLAGLMAVLDPDVVRRADGQADVHGAAVVAQQARVSRGGAGAARLALVDGGPGIVVAPRGRLQLALAFTVVGERIVAIDVISDRARLAALDVALLDG